MGTCTCQSLPKRWWFLRNILQYITLKFDSELPSEGFRVKEKLTVSFVSFNTLPSTLPMDCPPDLFCLILILRCMVLYIYLLFCHASCILLIDSIKERKKKTQIGN